MNEDFLQTAKILKTFNHKDFVQYLEKATPANIPKLIISRCYYDLQFFAKFFFTKEIDGKLTGHTKDPFNKMHLDFFDDYSPDDKDKQKVILAARGSAKTTLICLVYVLHRACYGLDKNVLILSSTTPLARTKSADLHSEVVNNDRLREYFSLDFAGSRQASKESFVIQSCFGECYIHSQGFFSQIRGTKFKENRPTLIILDDVVHGEEVFSEEQRIKADRQFKTDIKLASQPGTNFIYIGTRIHNDDLGSNLSRDPTWESKEYPAFIKWPKNMDLWREWEDIIRDPTKTDIEKRELSDAFYSINKEKMNEGADVLWPEREPTLVLMKERLSIGHKAFNAEKQMVAFLTGDNVFENITYFHPQEREIGYGFYLPKQDKFIEYDEARFVKYYAIDPATGERKKQTQKKTLSKSARIIAAKDMDTGVLYIIDCYMDRKPPSKIIYEMYDLHHHHNFHLMGFEENLFRDLYRDHIEKISETWEHDHGKRLRLPAKSIYNKIDKEQRIYSLEPKIAMAKIVINEHINPDFMAQLHTYPNSDHNDGLDALDILWKTVYDKGFESVKI